MEFITDDEAARLEELEKKATPGPWTRENVRAELVARIGSDCCAGADPLCSAGCLVEIAMRRNADRARAEELEKEIATAGVEFEDERVGYVSLQIPRSTWDECRAALAKTNTPSTSGDPT